MERRRIRGETRHGGWGKPLPAENRPEKIERGRRLVEAIRGRGTGAVPVPPRRAYEALLADLAAAELMPEWEIERAARNGGVDGSRCPPTPRQIEFAQGYANGESGNEVAHRLGVRMESVSRGLERLQFNLGARSRYQAIAMLVVAGYVSAPVLPVWSRSGRGVRARRLRPQHRVPVRDTVATASREELPADVLRPAELETLRMIADGLGNVEIAARRGVAEETVKSHVRLILRRLDARNRSHAVALGFRRGDLS